MTKDMTDLVQIKSIIKEFGIKKKKGITDIVTLLCSHYSDLVPKIVEHEGVMYIHKSDRDLFKKHIKDVIVTDIMGLDEQLDLCRVTFKSSRPNSIDVRDDHSMLSMKTYISENNRYADKFDRGMIAFQKGLKI